MQQFNAGKLLTGLTHQQWRKGYSNSGAVANLAQAQKTSPSDKIRAGCIGMGNIGLGVVKTISTVPGVEFVDLADI